MRRIPLLPPLTLRHDLIRPTTLRLIALAAIVAATCACNRRPGAALPTSPTDALSAQSTSAAPPPVHVVLFTHIEDNMPAGALSAPSNRTAYLAVRHALLQMGERARRYDVPWTLQPDWKLLEAARLYEDAVTMGSTGGVNVFRYLRDTLGVAIDPHSHESSGYNYTDVAHLLDLLGVGGSTVIGGHIWDPSLPQFQAWDRFRVPVSGSRYPLASWRGDILMGSGTPNHVNDPIVSGVWRPRDRFQYFEDDPAGNIVAVGAYKGDLAGIAELISVSQGGHVEAECLLTATYGIRPIDILAPSGPSPIDAAVLAPMASLRASGRIELTTFTKLAAVWQQRFGARACIYGGAGR